MQIWNKKVKMRSVFSVILLIQATILCIVSYVSINLFYRTHTELLYNESAEVLNLYFSRVEDRLKEVERLSFSILSDISIQEILSNIDEYGDTYEGYLAQQELRNKLLYKLFSVQDVLSIDFITNNNLQLSAGYAATQRSRNELDEIVAAGYQTYGSGSWETNLSGDGSISYVRMIRDIRKAGFKPLGILVINIDVDGIMAYSSVISSKFHSSILIMDENDLIYSIGAHNTNKAIDLPEHNQPYHITKIDGVSYFITEKKTDYVDWRFISLILLDDLLADINRLNQFVLVVFGVAALLSTGIGFKFSGLIAGTVVKLSRAMKRVESGNYDVIIPEMKGPLIINEVAGLQNDFNIMTKRIDYLINDVLKKEIKIREYQYKMLQQQINPHFLYNTLDTIYWMSQDGGNENVSNMVKSLSNMFRGSLAQDDIVSLEKEVRFLQDYITIQKTRFEERLDFYMDIPDEYLTLPIPKITLQPIVENSINYSLEKFASLCCIRVVAQKTPPCVSINISDNGPGMDEEFINKLLSGQSKPTKTGIGLKNIDERLRLLYGDEYGIQIQSSRGAGTTVTVRIPL